MSTNPKTVKWYNENAQNYTNHVRNLDQSIYHSLYEKPAMYALLPDLTGKMVLSLGCGSGEDSHYLKMQGAVRSIGIDLSSGMIQIATQSYSECEFRIMNMEKLDFPDQSIDFAYSSLAIHYLREWTSVFTEVFRILKPGGRFLFSCGHPMKSAMAMIEDSEDRKAQQLSIVIDKKRENGCEIMGNYLKRREIDPGFGKSGEVVTWHKSLGEIIGEATGVGFLIERFVEPQPLEKMRELASKDYAVLCKIPEFMIFRLIKH
jgi:SAM-dependent methyltransferase